jgi:hypothetical protein
MVIGHMISSTFAKVQKKRDFFLYKKRLCISLYGYKMEIFNQNTIIMKKIILVAAMVLGFAAAAVAQPRAVGIKLGWGVDASYQHTVGKDFVEATLGLNNFNSLDLGAVYNFMIAQPDWTDRGEWGFYAGPGAAVGMNLIGDNSYFHLAAAGMVGLEYSFWFPLQLSFDLRPQLGFGFGYGFHWSVTPSLGVRYKF